MTTTPAAIDFKTWDRELLEQFARECADSNHRLVAEVVELRNQAKTLQLAAACYRSLGGQPKTTEPNTLEIES